MNPRILIACEFSGVVREAFRKLGAVAFSCDLLPSEDTEDASHFQKDVREVIGLGWEAMIAFPPCTFLCNSGVRWLYNKDGTRNEPRWEKMREAAAFFTLLRDTPIKHICLENPIMHKHARKLIPGEPTQTLQPWQFGHGETKATQLWLNNLPPLQPTNIVAGRKPRVHHASPSVDRWKERSRTLPGLAQAMAEQWLPIILQHQEP